ncbi:NADP-dependent oxidoreductase [Dyadobacter sandarakinus]|uniref:NADP-dependent oxidoreductase n=1 Tax=Dyadobacter sandarakinus TaxID=2747268 RepID=A0ABX7I3X3_9BACT|nr:NADP-dependent oxidoreductase [Dyadobacter sandarakinus]QRR00563.1 NADP-dependent oxidoreductase [Dyadobacter sandarakinus]
MQAIILNDFGDAGQLIYTEVPVPEPAAGEVLIEVKAWSINPVDAKTRAGKGMAGRLKDQFPIILGWDISGTVVKTGADVTKFKEGDDVFGMVNFPGHGRGYAEFVAAPASHLALKPAGITHAEAAATTLAALTAYQALILKGPLHKGDKILVHAAAGGVGHFTVQLAKHIGAYVIGTSSAENRDYVLEIGADEHIDYKSQRFEELVSDADFVLDTIGGDNIVRSLEVLKPSGTLISTPTSVQAEAVAEAEKKGIRAFFFLVESDGSHMDELARLLADGTIKPFVNLYDFSQMREAHRQQESGKTKGKIVLTKTGSDS